MLCNLKKSETYSELERFDCVIYSIYWILIRCSCQIQSHCMAICMNLPQLKSLNEKDFPKLLRVHHELTATSKFSMIVIMRIDNFWFSWIVDYLLLVNIECIKLLLYEYLHRNFRRWREHPEGQVDQVCPAHLQIIRWEINFIQIVSIIIVIIVFFSNFSLLKIHVTDSKVSSNNHFTHRQLQAPLYCLACLPGLVRRFHRYTNEVKVKKWKE